MAAVRRGFELKVFGYMELTKLAYARMKHAGHGVIINDIGNSGENWDADYIAGSTGNASLMAFTRALGGVSLDDGIRVVGVNPGPVATDRMVKLMKRRAFDTFGDEARWEELFDRYPGGRPATPEEVADLMLFLASPRAAYITGTIGRSTAASRRAAPSSRRAGDPNRPETVRRTRSSLMKADASLTGHAAGAAARGRDCQRSKLSTARATERRGERLYGSRRVTRAGCNCVRRRRGPSR